MFTYAKLRFKKQFKNYFTVSTAKTVYTVYKKEAEVKRVVCENIAHQHGEAEQMVYFTSWVYQPQISDNITLKVEAMLIETGLRSIN